MPLFDFLKPKQAELEPTQTAKQHQGLAANAVLNHAATTGDDTAQKEHGQLTQDAPPHPSAMRTVKGALSNLFSGLVHKAEGAAVEALPFVLNPGAELGRRAAEKLLGPGSAPAGDQGHHLAPAAATPAAAPASKDNTADVKTQQFSQHGLPVTPQAWAMQDSIDNGKMHDIQKAVQAEVDKGKLPKTAAEQAVVDRYIQMANRTKGSTMMLEVLPTEMAFATNAPMDAQGHQLGEGGKMGDFRVGAEVAQTRQIAKAVANASAAKEGLDPESDAAKAKMFAMLVPYNNGGENIAMHDAIPQDAVKNLHNLLGKVDKNVNTVATGYSQGGGAVLEYAHKYGGTDGLDKVVAMAPMGGADRLGASGTFSGTMKKDHDPKDKGVDVLSLMNAGDPAQHIYDPLRDRPLLHTARNLMVDKAGEAASSTIGNILHAAMPGPMAAFDGAKSVLAADGYKLAKNGVESGLKANGQPEAAQTVEELAPLIPMMQKEKPSGGDILSIAPSMGNFVLGGGLHNDLKDGTGWLGQKTEQASSVLRVAETIAMPFGGHLLSDTTKLAGQKLEGTAAGMHYEDGALHGAPDDHHFDKGTYGYPMEKAFPLLQTFLGGGQAAADPKVKLLQDQIAKNHGQDYGRRGDWDFTRASDSK